MTTITTRAGKGSPLTHTEMDTNFTNLNTAKLEDLDSRSSVSPSLNLDFTTGVLDPRITFTRASTATYTDKFGVLKTANVNTPRFDYDPVTGESKGLLIEEQRTNLLTYSDQFDNAAWTLDNVTVTPNVCLAPDGTQSADLITASSSSTYWRVRKSGLSGITNTNITESIYVKKGNADVIGMNIDGNASVTYTFSTNTFSSVGSSVVSTSSTLVGNGWVRLSVVVNSAAWAPSPIRLQSLNDTVYIWGAQLEVGSFATSYIPTVASQVTRSADNASMTGTNFSSWWRSNEGTVYVEADSIPYFGTITGAALIAEINDGTLNNTFGIRYDTGGTQMAATMITNGVNQTSYVLSGTLSQGFNKFAHSFGSGVRGAVLNSSAVNPGAYSALPSVNRLTIGVRGDGYNSLNGTIKRIMYYPKRLSNTELKSITS